MSFTTPETLPPNSPLLNPVNAPSDSEKVTNYYSPNNVVVAGTDNEIVDSHRCSILNGANNFISGKYNAHVIGDYMGMVTGDGQERFLIENNSLSIGCYNGVHVYGPIIGKSDLKVDGDVFAFYSSDERLKDDITLIENPLEKVLSLDAIEFNWNDNQSSYEGHDIGLIAQQVEKVAPELVITRSNGYKAIKYDKVNSLLVGAIREQQDKIDLLEKRLKTLEKKSNH